MSKKQIVRIAGIASAVIFAMGALFPFVSMEFFGTKMSKSLINTSDGIFFILDAVLFAVTMFLSEKISLYICAATAVILTIADTQSFLAAILPSCQMWSQRDSASTASLSALYLWWLPLLQT